MSASVTLRIDVAMTDDQRIHLQLIQGVISRMASNSFALKGWSVTVSAALLGLAAKDARLEFAVIALYPALSFWGLDAYYLRQERRFRKLYDAVRTDGTVPAYLLDPTGLDEGVESWFSTMRSAPTVLAMHIPIVSAVFGVLAYLFLR